MLTQLVFLLHCGTTLYLTGLIWTIQLVHYPTFRWVDPERFVEFEEFHTRAMCWVVIPAMVIELITGIALVWIVPRVDVSFWTPFVYANLILVVLVWLSTFFLSVPLHETLSQQRDAAKIDKLVKTNWLRTVFWTLKMLLLFAVLVRFLSN
ncbi:MAG: putative membrane protein [Planctomycetota bacterium]|jgi:uncharacterized membrane protein